MPVGLPCGSSRLCIVVTRFLNMCKRENLHNPLDQFAKESRNLKRRLAADNDQTLL